MNRWPRNVFVMAGAVLCIAATPFSAQAATVSLGASSFVELTGEVTLDAASIVTASAGDVNNDGFDDFLVGTKTNDDIGTNAGAAYLVYGKSADVTSDSLGGTANTIVEFTGESVNDYAGTAVSAAGDVNGDGYDDFIIGAYQPEVLPDPAGVGFAYLIYGQADAFASTVSLSDSSIVKFTGEAVGDHAGTAVASAGDLDNDGYDDFLISANNNDPSAIANAGAVYVIYGQSALLTDSNLSDAIKFAGEESQDNAGSALGSGDFNGDGYTDILIGAYLWNASNYGRTYVLYGGSADLTGGSLSSADAIFTGVSAEDSAGWSVASAGDIDNDGYDDIVIGAEVNDDAGAAAGAAYVIYGQADPFVSASLSTAIEFTGEAAGDNAGYKVNSLGDINNDGFGDFVIGANLNDDGGADAGSVYVIFGQADALTDAGLGDSAFVEFTGEAAGDKAGTSAGSAGDINNDGYVDLIIGARLNDDGGTDAGAAYVLYSDPSTITITDNTTPANTVECATGTFSDPGATATDQYTNTSLTVSTADVVASTPVGVTAVTYTTDANLLHIVGTATRTVTVSDTVSPVITVTGSDVLLEFDDVYADAGAAVIDACDSGVAVVTTGSVDTSTIGEYTLTYSAADASSNPAVEKTRTVTVVDTADPVITMIGSDVTVEAGDTYVDAGATAADSYDGDITSSIVTANSVDTSTLGIYTVTYNVNDSSGNSAIEVSRTVTVVDTSVPVITLLGEETVTLNQGDAYVDAGAVVTDSYDGDLTGSVVTVNPVDVNTPGTYTITYNVSDSSGNPAVEVTRTVIVQSVIIGDAVKNDGTINLTYDDGRMQSITPFGGSKRFVYRLTTDLQAVVATNGKFVRIFVDGIKIDQQKMNKKSLRTRFVTVKVKKLYRSKAYDDVMVMLGKKGLVGKVVHLRVTAAHQLAHIGHQLVNITQRKPGKITVKPAKHRFITAFGQNASITRSVWRVTRKGILKAL